MARREFFQPVDFTHDPHRVSGLPHTEQSRLSHLCLDHRCGLHVDSFQSSFSAD